MVARLTAAEAKKLGIDTPEKKQRTTRKEVTGVKYHTRCTTCLAEFTTIVAEDRHLHDTHHGRYEVVSP